MAEDSGPGRGPQLVEIARELRRSRMASVAHDFHDLIRTARGKISSSAKGPSFGFVSEALAAGCGWECADCGLALASYGLGVFSLFLACGSTVGVGCILAVVEGRLAALSLVLSCGDCIECLF